MRVVVLGGTGLIGTKVVAQLTAEGHDVTAASRATGVNSYTGDGLADALDGAETLIDVSNSPYTDYDGAVDFFTTSTLNLISYGRRAGIRHHVVLSIVGTDRLAAAHGLYFQAKLEQERLVQTSGTPFSIVHSTQFFEFVRYIAETAAHAGRIPLARALIRPVAGDDTAAVVARTALGSPTGTIREMAGPEEYRLDELVRTELRVRKDPREVVADPLGEYFGTTIGERDLLPGPDAELFPTRFTDWLLDRSR